MDIIYEDENILAINKPADLLVHPVREVNSKSEARNSKQQTIIEQITTDYPEAELAHRLDKETSGVLLIARNHEIYEFLKEQFKNRKVKKTYTALVKGNVKNSTGIINTPIKRFTKERDAVTEYKVLENFLSASGGKDYTLLQVSPKTGRTHQIRIHLKSIGHPVVCDKLYTKKLDCVGNLKRHFLHASAIELTGPDGVRIKIEADLSKDLQEALTMLKERDVEPAFA